MVRFEMVCLLKVQPTLVFSFMIVNSGSDSIPPALLALGWVDFFSAAQTITIESMR